LQASSGDLDSFASIDLGSHTIRLLIARLENGRILFPLRNERKITRLARDFENGERLVDSSMQQSLDALKEYEDLLHQYQVRTVVCGATGVLRRAKNADRFLKKIREHSGLRVSILSEKSEAILSAKGVLSFLPLTGDMIILFDLGGSSTEFLMIVPNESEPIFATSVFTGAATITQKYLSADPPGREDLTAASEAIRATITPTLTRMKTSVEACGGCLDNILLVGTAGTVTTLASMHLQMDNYEPCRVNGLSLSQNWLTDTVAQIKGLPIAARRGIRGLEQGREDIILGGALIVFEILRGLGQQQFMVTDAGLLEGLMLHLIESRYGIPHGLQSPLTWHCQKR
jgi:exopolyphosphatase / guanosine-5'-triphosphate,3'-diphosphate pyrophosphatase